MEHFKTLEENVVRYGIVVFWTIFWFLNVVDKFVGGSIYLWVGKDRFAQLFKFFASLGVENPAIAIESLILVTVLEIVAFVLVGAALMYLIQKDAFRARFFFFWGTFAGLVTFSFFAMGDQVFGDRFELLEHSIFWIALIVSWGIYSHVSRDEKLSRRGKKFWTYVASGVTSAAVIAVALSVAGAIIITTHSREAIRENPQVVEPTALGQGVYKFDLPFLATRKTWEHSLVAFRQRNPALRVVTIHTAPKELKNKADNTVIFVITERR